MLNVASPTAKLNKISLTNILNKHLRNVWNKSVVYKMTDRKTNKMGHLFSGNLV